MHGFKHFPKNSPHPSIQLISSTHFLLAPNDNYANPYQSNETKCPTDNSKINQLPNDYQK